jgi:hypothetical protein
MWIGEVTPEGVDEADFRHRFLEAFSEGQISSARDFPEDGGAIAALRAVIVRVGRKEIVLRDGEAVFRSATSPPTVQPELVAEDGPLDVPLPGVIDYQSLKVGALAALCRDRGITPAGSKAELIAALQADDA